jgi:proline iminopeptidase
VAQSYATRHPQHPRALALCNTAARFRQDRVLDAFERLGGAEARRAATAYLNDPGPESMADYARLCLPLYNRRPQDPDFLPRTMAQANFALAMSYFRGELRRFDFTDALARVCCPTLVVTSDDDPITPPADGEDIAAALPPHLVRLERFPGCGHPAYQDDPERFFRVLRQFVGSV